MVLCAVFVSAQSKPALDYQWSFDVYGDNLGRGGLLVKDSDNNGIIDILVTGTSGSPTGFDSFGMFSIIEFSPEHGTYRPKRISRLFFYEITATHLADLDADGTDEILIGFTNGEIKVIDSRTFNEIRSIHTFIKKGIFYSGEGIAGIATGDIDNDGTRNIVATNKDTTYIFSLTGKLIKKSSGPKGSLILTNIDHDSAIETLYSGGQVIEYSVAEAKEEYTFFPAGYSKNNIRVADMNRDNISDLLYSSRDSVHIVDVANKRKILSIGKGEYGAISDFQLHDYTGDGIPEIFAGNDQFEVLFVFNGFTGQLEFELHDMHRNGLDALVIGNVDNEPGDEIIYASGAGCTCLDHIYVYDMQTKSLKWLSTFRSSALNAFDVGRFSNDDNDDLLVIGNQGQHTGWSDRGFLSGFVLKDKRFAWGDNQSEYGPFQHRASAIRFGDIDNDGQNELLIGVEGSYASTRVYAYDSDFNVKRTFEISGMSYIADILVADFDNDDQNEIIVTSGTWVSGSTHPDEWKNFVYIFDGASGSIEWKSPQLGGMSSRVGNILVGNIDGDPAMEVVMAGYRFDSWQSKPSAILVLDGWTNELKLHDVEGLTTIELDDFDKDGIEDLIVGTSGGDLLVLDGHSFDEKRQLLRTTSGISALRKVDINDDGISEFIFADQFRVRVLDVANSRIVAQTDTLNWRTGEYNSIKIYEHANDRIEVLVNAGHTLYSFDLDSVPNRIPAMFSLITPMNDAELPSTGWLEFDWEPSMDDDLVTYTFSLRGGDMDSVVTNIPQTHLTFKSSLFAEGQSYQWSVIATDQYESIASETFSFRIVPMITGINDEVHARYELYPNPFQNSFSIRNEGTDHIDEIRINDLRGTNHLRQQVSIPLDGDLLITNLEDFPSGIYICTLSSRGTVVYKVKLVKY